MSLSNFKFLFLNFLAEMVVSSATGSRSPNVLLFLADDLGYGDLPFFGHPTSLTPNLSKLSSKSKIFTNYYAASPVCSPSRASLLTGLYPISTGVWPGVFFPEDLGGLGIANMAEYLRDDYGYRTAHVGKWHLGHGVNGSFLPTNHGFQRYLGIPYSHDMCPCLTCFPGQTSCSDKCREDYVGCPLFKNLDIVEQPADLTTLTSRYVAASIDFIRENGDPFFLYFAFHQPHHPQFSGDGFFNSSDRGTFGDSLSEMDDAVGKILSALHLEQRLDNTVVIFTSDNGPSLCRHEEGGSAGLLRCGKGTTWEGGMRVPAMISWQHKILPGIVHDLMTHLDVLPTIMTLVGGDSSRLDTHGYDFSNLLLNNSKGPRKEFLYYPMSHVDKTGPMALRYVNFKAHFLTEGNTLSDDSNYDHVCRGDAHLVVHDPPIVYDLDSDPGERYPLDMTSSPQRAKILQTMLDLKVKLDNKIVFRESEVNKGHSRSAAPCCGKSPKCEPFPKCCDCSP